MLLAILQSHHGADYFYYIYHKEYDTSNGKYNLPYKEMSKIRLFHVNKMAARFCSVNQQLYLQ